MRGRRRTDPARAERVHCATTWPGRRLATEATVSPRPPRSRLPRHARHARRARHRPPPAPRPAGAFVRLPWLIGARRLIGGARTHPINHETPINHNHPRPKRGKRDKSLPWGRGNAPAARGTRNPKPRRAGRGATCPGPPRLSGHARGCGGNSQEGLACTLTRRFHQWCIAVTAALDARTVGVSQSGGSRVGPLHLPPARRLPYAMTVPC